RDDRTLEDDVLRHAARQIDGGGIAPRHDAALRRQQEVVEGAAANEIGDDASGGGGEARELITRHTVHNRCTCVLPLFCWGSRSSPRRPHPSLRCRRRRSTNGSAGYAPRRSRAASATRRSIPP